MKEPSESVGTTKPIAVVILTAMRRESSEFDPAFQRVQGRPLIRFLVDRLVSGWEERGASFALLVPQHPQTLKRFDLEFNADAIEVIATPGSWAVEMLGAYAEMTACQTLVIYPELAVFPDVASGRKMLCKHLQTRADATVAVGAPAGFLPVIVQVDAVKRVSRLGLPADCGADIISILERASGFFEDDAFRFTVQYLDTQDAGGVAYSELPSSLLVSDAPTRSAVAAVLSDSDGRSGCNVDSREAKLLKQELLRSVVAVREGRRKLARESAQPVAVLFISYVRGLSGAEASWEAMIANLDRRRFAPIVVLPNASALSQRLTEAQVRVEIVDWDFTSITPLNLAYFSDMLESWHIGLVDVNGRAGMPVLIAARERGIPVVTHIRTYDSVAHQHELQFSEALIAISETVRKDVLRAEISPDRVRTIYNGVDLGKFFPGARPVREARACWGLNDDEQVIAVVARIHRQKRYEVLFDALSSLCRKNARLKVLCVGCPELVDEPYQRELVGLTRRLGIEDAIKWVGFTNEMVSIYAASDVLVLCNPQEPFGRCLIESMAMGVPVVVPRGGGPLEIVEEEINGLFFEPENGGDLAHKLQLYFDDSALRARLRLGAVASARRFSVSDRTHEVMELFEMVLNDCSTVTEVESLRFQAASLDHFGS